MLARVSSVIVLALVFGVSAGLRHTSLSAAAQPDTVRILIYGDSITQGSSGDHTWRYYVDRSLRASGVAFDFMGPVQTLKPVGIGSMGDDDLAYADPRFDRDAAAWWGQRLTQPRFNFAQETARGNEISVSVYRPDVAIMMVGFNDINRLGLSPQAVIDSLERELRSARALRPGIDIVLVKYPAEIKPFVASYNHLLDTLAERLDQGDERVVATSDYSFDLQLDTWDGVHPTGRGDAKVARQVAAALSQLGIGHTAVSTAVPYGLPKLTVASVQALPGGAEVQWSPIPGATSYQVEYRETGTAKWRIAGSRKAESSRSLVLGNLQGGRSYDVRVRTKKGWLLAQNASELVSVKPHTALTRVKVGQRKASVFGRIRVSWSAVPQATDYEVEVHRSNRTLKRSVVSAPQWSGSGFRGGDEVRIRVRAEVGGVKGQWSKAERISVPTVRATKRVSLREVRDGLEASGKNAAPMRTATAPITGATGYRLATANSATCARPPKAGRFRATYAGKSRRITLKMQVDRPRAFWVQWRGERAGVPGRLSRGSYACLRVG